MITEQFLEDNMFMKNGNGYSHWTRHNEMHLTKCLDYWKLHLSSREYGNPTEIVFSLNTIEELKTILRLCGDAAFAERLC